MAVPQSLHSMPACHLLTAVDACNHVWKSRLCSACMPACMGSSAPLQSSQCALRPLTGLEVAGLVECLEALLEMALIVHNRCAVSTAALLDMLDTGMRISGTHEGVISLPCQTLDQGILAECTQLKNLLGR